jgi:hypothetical protein
MPAFILLLKVKRVVIPLPWFIIWLLAIPFALLGWLVGSMALVFFPRSYAMLAASQAWRVVLLMMRMQGIRVHVDTEDEEVLVQFI